MFGLQHLISPIFNSEFIENYWGKRAVYIPGNDEKFHDLFGWDDINEQINYSDYSASRFKLILDKQQLHSDALREIRRWLTQGATLVSNSVQRYDPVLEHFASALGKDLNTIVNINSYTSFPEKQGFDIHYDGHDVFIIQTAGNKKWAVFEPTFLYPLERHTTNRPSPPDPEKTEPYLECTTHPGDVLYIPRGHWHYALANSPSIHLTVGPQSRSGAQFLHWLTDQMANEIPSMRQDFPIADSEALGGHRNGEDITDHLQLIKDLIMDRLNRDDLNHAFLEYCMSNALERRQAVQLPEAGMLMEQISNETVFRFIAEEKFIVNMDEDTNKAKILFRGGSVDLKDMPKTALDVLFSGTSQFTGKSILNNCQELSWNQLKPVLLTLYSRGVIFLQT